MKIKTSKYNVRESYYCDKCGKRLSITVIPYLRHRLKLCECNKQKF